MKLHYLLAILLVAAALYGIGSFPFPSSGLAPLAAELQPDRWFPWIHLSHNAFLYWKIDSLLAPFVTDSSWCMSAACPSGPIPLVSLLVLGLSSAALFLTLEPRLTASELVFFPLLACFVLLWLFGYDLIILSSLAWAPLLVLLLYHLLRGSSAPFFHVVLLLFVSVRLAKSAQWLGLTIGLLSSLFALTLARSARQAESSVTPRGLLLLLLLALGPSLYSLTFLPRPHFDYEAVTHVVPSDGLEQMVKPLLGPATRIPFIDRNYVKRSTLPSALILVIAFALVLMKRSDAPLKRTVALAGLVVASCVLLDASLSEPFSQIAPCATIARLIPGLFFYPASFLLLAIAVWLVFSLLAIRRLTVFALVVAIVVVVTTNWWLGSNLTRRGALLRQDAVRGFQEFSEKRDRTYSPVFSQEVERLLVSPSYQILSTVGLWIIERREEIQAASFAYPAAGEPQLSASHNSTSSYLATVFDGDVNSRWTAQRAFQGGDEWFEMCLPEKRVFRAVELSPGSFIFDYPRHIRVFARESSDVAAGGAPTFQPIIEIPSREGSIVFSDNGFPAYSKQSEVKVYFPHDAETSCLRVQQLGRNTRFDWSIAELKLSIVN